MIGWLGLKDDIRRTVVISKKMTKMESLDYRVFDLAGSHAQAGYELGKADTPFQMQSWWFPPPPASFALTCEDILREIHPHLIDEHRAYADAQRLNAATLWQRCCRVNLKARVNALPTEQGEGCSTFARFSNSAVVVGRNYDYWQMQTRRQRIRFSPDCCANASIGARGSVPCGRYDGINTHGVFFSLHVVMTDTPRDDEIRPGIPFHLVGRLVLELCNSAREARDLLMQIPHLSSLNYMVADSREAFVVEADPRRVRVIERNGVTLAVTNHFRHPDMLMLQGNRINHNSKCRLSFLSRHDERKDALSISELLDQAEQIMADRTAPVCGQSGPLSTLWSCVAELTTKQIRYCPGAPGVVEYERLDDLMK
jgi:predicted choloylglycine hydrolase